ncbi:MAG: cadherin-like beta sandwich domain-containing protein, partial [Firmicutes bacterium]|nr:cadherin-like beta sandwich domain-containing protein [Bacillota bacterium]
DYFLKTLEVAGYDLLPKFNKYTDSYEVVVPSDTTKVSINAVPNSSTSKVKGAGNVTLTGNVTNIKITVTASSGATKDYHISVARQTLGAAKVESSVYKVGSNITGVDFNTSVSKFKSNIKVTSGYTFKVMDKNGKELTSGNVGTNSKVVVYNGSSAVKTIPIVIKGDNNGDGKLSSADVLFVQRHIVKTYTLSGSYLDGSDINGDGKISSVDVLFMQRHIVGTYTIKQ